MSYPASPKGQPASTAGARRRGAPSGVCDSNPSPSDLGGISRHTQVGATSGRPVLQAAGGPELTESEMRLLDGNR